MVESAPAMGEDGVSEVALSSPLEDYALAGSGRYLVLKMAGESRVAVYDTSMRAIAGHLDVGSTEYVIGAGGNLALVFAQERDQLQCWDLEALAMTNRRTFDEPLVVTHIIMGHGRSDLAVLRVGVAPESEWPPPPVQMSLRLVDPRECAPLGFGLAKRNLRDEQATDYVHFRATGDLRRITQWCTSHTPSGMGQHRIEGRRFGTFLYSHDSRGSLAIGEDGNIYTSRGEVLRFAEPSGASSGAMDPFSVVCRFAGRALVPGLSGALLLGVSNSGQVDLYSLATSGSLGSIGEFPQWNQREPPSTSAPDLRNTESAPDAGEESIRSPMTLDRRIIFSPSLGFVVLLPFSNRAIVQRRFDVRETLDRSGKDYLLMLNSPETDAVSGTQWRHRMAVAAKHDPVAFSLETFPEGMTITAEGELCWNVPSGTRGEADVVVVVIDRQGKKIRQEFSIRFAPAEAGSTRRV